MGTTVLMGLGELTIGDGISLMVSASIVRRARLARRRVVSGRFDTVGRDDQVVDRV